MIISNWWSVSKWKFHWNEENVTDVKGSKRIKHIFESNLQTLGMNQNDVYCFSDNHCWNSELDKCSI